MVIHELIKSVYNIIGDSSDTGMLDARLIVMKATDNDSVHLVINKNDEVSDKERDYAFLMAEQRKKHMPVAYITGVREFMSLNFKVAEGVLIPRPDTECIAEEAIKRVKCGRILDIGTGSGALAVSLAYYIREAQVTAIDISDAALATACENARLNGVDIDFVKADIFDFETDDKFDLIISNPPYIESTSIETLMAEVRDFEPRLALDGGCDGLDFYRKITDFAVSHLTPGGLLIYEFGCNQHDAVKKITMDAGFEFVGTIYDLSGIRRGCTVKNKS